MHMPDPTFPPLLAGHAVAGAESPFEAACEGAMKGELGAGDVVWSRNTSGVRMAIVLEPEVGMARAVQMLPLAMVALGDCLGALTPPQVGVGFIWPNVVCINGAPAAAFRAAAAATARDDEVPDWLVVGLELRHMREPGDPEPGETPDITWLAEEGGGELTRTEIIESYSRHFLTWINSWSDDGFRPVHASWLFRSEQRDKEIALTLRGKTHRGKFVGLDDSGNLLLRGKNGKIQALLLGEFFERPATAGQPA